MDFRILGDSSLSTFIFFQTRNKWRRDGHSLVAQGEKWKVTSGEPFNTFPICESLPLLSSVLKQIEDLVQTRQIKYGFVAITRAPEMSHFFGSQ